MGPQPRSNAIAQSTEQAALSCQECRRRKIKCDRQLPTCVACLSSSMACVYPAGPLKPGPKPGFTRRPKKRKLESQYDSQGTMDMGLPTMLPQHDTNAGNAEPGQSFASHLPGQLPSLNISGSSAQDCGFNNPNEPSGPFTPSQSPEESSFLAHRRLSWLVHPNHESTLKQPDCAEESQTETLTDQSTPLPIPRSLMDQICHAFQTDERDVHHLIDLYFENMLAFTLFPPRLLAIKLQTASPSRIIALLAAMFSFSARFRMEYPRNDGDGGASEQQGTLPTANSFYLIAKDSVDRDLTSLKSPPPLLLLQSMVLLSFHDLIESTEGTGWRSVGPLVRIAYELRLHQVDYNGINTSSDHPDLWSAKEERRRIWWAIWELDVFTSTVRRLPSAIDWNQNWTMLPVDDESWVRKAQKPSCYLVADPMERFKSLQNCGNQSGKAWFIVANSLMRTTYCVSNLQEYFWTPPSFIPPQPGRQALPQQQISTNLRTAHEILSNSFYCFTASLPPYLKRRGQRLFNSTALASKSTKQRDSDIYSIHIMVKLAEFMMNDPNDLGSRSTRRDSWFSKKSESLNSVEGQQFRDLSTMFEKNISMAEAISLIVRNSGPDHVHLVNPFLACTIWIAAAVFIAYKYLGIPSDGCQETPLVDSNIDLLKTNFHQFVQWWDMSDVLETKLSEIESELACMRRTGSATSNDLQQHSPGMDRQESAPRPANARSDGLSLSQNSYDPAISEGMVMNPTSQIPHGNPNTLDPSTTLGLIQDGGSLPSTYETSSCFFDTDFNYDVGLQGFLDGMFATFRGQDL